MHALACPTCGQVDSSQSVRAIVEGETTIRAGSMESTHFNDGSAWRGVSIATSGSVESTALALRLKRFHPGDSPDRDRAKKDIGDSPLGTFGVRMSAYIGVPAFFAAFASFVAGESGALPLDTSRILSIVLLAIFLICFKLGYRALQADPVWIDYEQRISDRHMENLRDHIMSLEHWNKLMFCRRCFGVYVPGDSEVTRL